MPLARPFLVAALFLAYCGSRGAFAVQFRYKFVKGDVATYRTLIAAAGQNQSSFSDTPLRMQMRVDVLSRQKVLSVGGDGTAQIESKDISGKTRTQAFGKSQTTPVTPETTIFTLTNRGRLVRYRQQTPAAAGATSRAGEEGAEQPVVEAAPPGFENADPLKVLFGLNFPNRDLQPGETWTMETKVDVGPQQSVVVKIASRFAALTRFRGRPCAKIVTAFEVPTPDEKPFPEDQGITVAQEGKITGQITTYFDPAEGREIYADGSVVMITKSQMTGPADALGAPQSAEMNTIFKMNLRSLLVKSMTPKGKRR